MPRRARISIPGIPWHIIQRGNNRSACFYSDDDYRLYLHYLHDLAEQFACKIHAYVLMTNHVHLLLTPEAKESAALLMKNLGQRYVQYINRTYHRSGTLWEGRYRSCLTQNESYVLACYRYIELNPVRAGMVKHPREYAWSSYRFNAEGQNNDLLTPHPLYLGLAEAKLSCHKSYQKLVAIRSNADVENQIRSATNGNYVLGDKKFQRKIEKALGRRVSKRKAGRPKSLKNIN